MCKIAIDFDELRADKFANELLEGINKGALTLMISIGHRTGLFDTMSVLPPSTSAEIADAAKLNERYVREWLGAMVTGGIVEIDEIGPRYHLPREHASFLTRKAGADNMALFAQYIPVLAGVEEQILDCFKNGGGVPYEAYDRFHEVMAEDSGQSVLSSLHTDVLPLVSGLEQSLIRGINVLDVGCGSGKAMISMARKYPNSKFTGYDLCPEPIESANKEAEDFGLDNIVFEVKDLTHALVEKQFDFITAFDSIHDQARPDLVLEFIHASLNDEGIFLMQDINAHTDQHRNIDHPMGTLLYTISCMHCMTVSLSQKGGMGLGAMWGEEKAREMLDQANFGKVKVSRLEHDFQNCYYIAQK